MSKLVYTLVLIGAYSLVGIATSRYVHAGLDAPSLEIIGGHVAKSSLTKSVVKLNIEKWNKTTHKWEQFGCGGTLISKKYVLTAAHCLYETGNVTVILGMPNLWTYTEGTQIIKAKKKYIHEGYNDYTLLNDIATIELEREAQLNSDVKTAELPTWADVGKTYAGKEVRAYGWGRTGDKFRSSNTLMAVKVPVLSVDECRRRLARIPDTDLCTSTTSKKNKFTGTCFGDSGGPLFDNRTQIAIASFVVKHCEAPEPDGFVRINNYLKWIRDHSDVTIKKH